jgi:6-pyruvoyltetrahydropterin/6-carboxytetrahydropterin synthase
MWRLSKRARFEASHVLTNHGGKCARLHGHSWQVEIEVVGSSLQSSGPSAGMVMDFGDMAAPLARLIEAKLDHYHLNDSTGLTNPTSEEIARWIYEQLVADVPALMSVTVEETCTSRSQYAGA